MAPQTQQVRECLFSPGLHHQHALEDLGEVPEVECVVGLVNSTQQYSFTDGNTLLCNAYTDKVYIAYLNNSVTPKIFGFTDVVPM